MSMPAGVDLCLIPAATPPEGVTPNFENPITLATVVVSVSITFTAISLVVALGRFWANRFSLKLADYSMLFALIVHLGFTGIVTTGASIYRHQWDIPACMVDATYLKKLAALVFMGGPTLFFPKAAIFLFYLQIFSVNKLVRIGSRIGIVVSFLCYIPLSIVVLVFNTPRSWETWEHLLITKRGAKTVPYAIAMGAMSVVLDIYIFILPLPSLLKLNLAQSKRFQLLGLFATASLGIVASVIGLVFRVRLYKSTDGTWDTGAVETAVIIESSVAIIVGCLPAFAQFLRIYIADSTWYKSLRSNFGGTTKSEFDVYDSNQQKPRLWTFGSGPPRKQRPSYFELTEAGTIKSQVTAPSSAVLRPAPNSDGIVRTMAFTQEEHRNSSEEKLTEESRSHR